MIQKKGQRCAYHQSIVRVDTNKVVDQVHDIRIRPLWVLQRIVRIACDFGVYLRESVFAEKGGLAFGTMLDHAVRTAKQILNNMMAWP
jgi:hypothetical protein